VNKVRLIIGFACIAIAIWIFLSGELSDNPAPGIAAAAIGVILIAISRRRK
jgi:hypothetical protein